MHLFACDSEIGSTFIDLKSPSVYWYGMYFTVTLLCHEKLGPAPSWYVGVRLVGTTTDVGEQVAPGDENFPA